MNTVRHFQRPGKRHSAALSVPGLLLALLLSISSASAQDTAGSTAAADGASASSTSEFDQAHLEQLVAPIALYPDSLLTQILMASTYPLEIVEADRFMKKNKDLKGDALDQALLDHDWDPSIKAMCTLPDVLARMSENLDWTQDLGDAFLGQQAELMDTVQHMRAKAYDAGNLETTEQQTVTQQPDQIIVIQQSDPQVIYVPTYNPTVIYGPAWVYPHWYYPPMYYYPPGYGLWSFSVGVAVGAAFWGDCHWGWGRTDIDININRYNQFNRNTNIHADRYNINANGRDGKANWQHDASHRKGVNYRSEDVARRHGASTGSNRVTQNQARGYTGASNRAAGASGSRAGSNRNTAATNNRPSTGDRAGTPGGSQNRASSRDFQSSRNSAYSGSRSPSMDRHASSRGAMSRGTPSFGGTRGGATRAGGRRR